MWLKLGCLAQKERARPALGKHSPNVSLEGVWGGVPITTLYKTQQLSTPWPTAFATATAPPSIQCCPTCLPAPAQPPQSLSSQAISLGGGGGLVERGGRSPWCKVSLVLKQLSCRCTPQDCHMKSLSSQPPSQGFLAVLTHSPRRRGRPALLCAFVEEKGVCCTCNIRLHAPPIRQRYPVGTR